jgi:hypothetical protein
MEAEAGKTNSRLDGEISRSRFEFVVTSKNRADYGVRAYEGALVALDAIVELPLWHLDGNSAFFPGGYP